MLGYAPRSQRLAQLLRSRNGCSRSHCVCLDCTVLGMPSVLHTASFHPSNSLLRERPKPTERTGINSKNNYSRHPGKTRRRVPGGRGIRPRSSRISRGMSSNVQSSCSSKQSFSDARMPRVVGCRTPRMFVESRRTSICIPRALFKDDCATLDDLREAVTTLEDTERIARRVLGGAHPTTGGIEAALRGARAALRARETPPSPPVESS